MALDGRRRIVALLAVLAVVATVTSLARLISAPSYSLLYSGLEPDSAGEVVCAIEQQGVAYEIRGGSILVDVTKRDQLRMTLAADGLPMMSGQGYELLDTLSGFGTTAQMFDAAYWRAKEGELARTIQSGTHIRSARVHIANTLTVPFRPAVTGSASVTAISSAGQLTAANAQAMRYLVASAVAGLSPDDVAVIDGRTGSVIGADQGASGKAGSLDRAAELKRNVERLLEARVGVGNAIVEVNVETVTEREEIIERRFDPEGRVAISSETEESTDTASDSGSGGVTVASNLPEGDGSGAGQNSTSQNSKTREVVNYEVSETRREILRTPGAIRRISVAVLVDGITSTDPATGAQNWAPRSDEELAALHDLVASAIGYDAPRGDSLTIKSMQLSLPEFSQEVVAPSLVQSLNLDVMRLIQVAVLAIVTIILGLFVLRPLFARAPSYPGLPAPVGGPSNTGPVQLPAQGVDNAVESGALEIMPVPIAADLGGDGDIPQAPPLPMMPMQQVAIPPLDSGAGIPQVNPVDRLRDMIEDRQDETVEILQNWMQDDAERV